MLVLVQRHVLWAPIGVPIVYEMRRVKMVRVAIQPFCFFGESIYKMNVNLAWQRFLVGNSNGIDDNTTTTTSAASIQFDFHQGTRCTTQCRQELVLAKPQTNKQQQPKRE
jgi:hypothetical protein